MRSTCRSQGGTEISYSLWPALEGCRPFDLTGGKNANSYRPHWQNAIIFCTVPYLCRMHRQTKAEREPGARHSQAVSMIMTNLDRVESRRLVGKRRCSDCWEVFRSTTKNTPARAAFPAPHRTAPAEGHVSAEYVENALAESRLKRAEAERALGARGAVPCVPRLLRPTEAANLAEPGF
jgi:hypothetical protein